MKKMVVLAVLTASAPMSASTSASDYSPGYSWVRMNQFPPAHFYEAGKNYLRGNPWVDTSNNFVWSYEYLISNGGDGISDEPMPVPPVPWFRHGHPELLVWDDAFRGGSGGWVFDDDTPCVISDIHLVHDWSAEGGEAWKYVPVVRWRNPLDDGARFSVSGQLVVEWEGGDGDADGFVDIVILHDKRRGPNDPVVTIFEATLNRADGVTQTLPVNIAEFEPQNSESLLVSVKARVSGPSLAPVARVTVRDELVITLESAPNGYCPEDINRNGQVDFADLNRILLLFGAPCEDLD